MARKNGSGGVYHSTRQTGLANRTRSGAGSYARRHKSRHADKYDRPYADGSYLKWDSHKAEAEIAREWSPVDRSDLAEVA